MSIHGTSLSIFNISRDIPRTIGVFLTLPEPAADGRDRPARAALLSAKR
jgi:hypothetical protein